MKNRKITSILLLTGVLSSVCLGNTMSSGSAVVTQSFDDRINKDVSIYKKYASDVKRGVPPLFAAIQNHFYSKISEVLSTGVSIEEKNKHKDTPLFFALRQKDDKMIELLLKAGANPNVMEKNGLYSALSWSVSDNSISTVRLLLDNGADVNYQVKKSETALTVAAKGCKKFDMVSLLLIHGADPELMDTFKQNTLTGLKRYCTASPDYEKMKALLEK